MDTICQTGPHVDIQQEVFAWVTFAGPLNYISVRTELLSDAGRVELSLGERREEEPLCRLSSLIWIRLSSPTGPPIITLFHVGLEPPGVEDIT